MAVNRVGLCCIGVLRYHFTRTITVRTIFTAQRLQIQHEAKDTHTGQAYDSNDYRAVRYIDRVKEVNESFAIDMVDEVQPTEVEGRSIWCDGGDGALGHPKVYINLDEEGPQPCGYCGLRFVQKPHH